MILRHSFYIWQKMHRNILIESLPFNDSFIISTKSYYIYKIYFLIFFSILFLCRLSRTELMVEEDCCNDHNFLKSLTFGLTVTTDFSVVSCVFLQFQACFILFVIYEVLSKFWTWSVFTIKLILTAIKCNKVTERTSKAGWI